MAHRPRVPASIDPEAPPPPSVEFQSCPIAASLGTLGRKWTLTIIRDIAFFPGAGFTFIRKNNPGLLPRTLSLRLRQLSEEGIIRKEQPDGSRRVKYHLTEKGKDVWPVLTALLDFGSRHSPDRVFADGRPRGVAESYPTSSELLMGRLAEYARRGRPVPHSPG